VANALTDGAEDEDLRPQKSRKQAKPRTRPLHGRAAKGSGSSAASSEVDTEPEEDVPRVIAPTSKGKARKQKAASIEPGASDEEEPESQLVVLNGTTPSPRATPSPIRGSASKGSARKRRRGSEEANETPASQRKKKDKEINPPPDEDDDEDSFVGRRLKRIKR
jgi:hypothetical protein